MKRANGWRAGRIVAVSVAAAVSALITAAPANAATPYQFTLCSDGYYYSYAVFPSLNMATKVVAPGTCATVGFSSSGTVYTELYESNGQVVGGFSFDRSSGAGVSTTGTAASPGYYRW